MRGIPKGGKRHFKPHKSRPFTCKACKEGRHSDCFKLDCTCEFCKKMWDEVNGA